MSVLSAIGGFFKKLGTWIKKGLVAAVGAGLTDEIVKAALGWVKVAADRFVDNGEKREFVVRMLTTRGIPEGVARLAVELAVQIYKKESAKLNQI